ncbi:MAG: hypothetical protein ACQETI_10590 [Halobacteriota archaeon]
MRRRQVLTAGVGLLAAGSPLLEGCTTPGLPSTDSDAADATIELEQRLEVQVAVDDPIEIRMRVTDYDDGTVVADETTHVERWATLHFPANAPDDVHRVELFLDGVVRFDRPIAAFESYTLTVHDNQSVEVTEHAEI